MVRNLDFRKGLSTSLISGINAVPDDCDGAVVLLGDMPDVTAHTIDRLIAAFDPEEDRAICVATRDGKRGNPVLWSREFFPDIRKLEGDVGAKSLIGENADTRLRGRDGRRRPAARHRHAGCARGLSGAQDMSDPLYKKELLRLAADAHGAGRLAGADATATPTIPSAATRSSSIWSWRTAASRDIGQEAKACVLTQASASILGKSLKGAARGDVEALRRRSQRHAGIRRACAGTAVRRIMPPSMRRSLIPAGTLAYCCRSRPCWRRSTRQRRKSRNP